VVASLLLLAVLLGPAGVFYLRWQSPNEALLPVDESISVSVVSDSVDALHAQANLDAVVSVRNSSGMPSVSAAVAYAGNVQWAGVVGYADLEKSIPASLTSRYRIGSVSKSLTGVALARLIDKNAISLEDYASKYVADLPTNYSEVTVGMLASHTSGVRHYSVGAQLYWPPWHPAFSGREYSSVEEGLEIFIDDELLFPPGTDFQYSTYGYSLLARVMEEAGARRFGDLLKEELFVPAGMTNTAVDVQGSMPGRVSFYVTSLDEYTEAYPTNQSYKIAGGGMVSTPSDLVTLGQVLLHEDLISEELRRDMWTPVELPDGSENPQGYGLGWRVNQSTRLLGEDEPTPIFHHGGRQNGGVGFLILVPEYGISAAALANTGSGLARGGVERLCYELVRLAVAHANALSPDARNQ
jgi:CubicO group peptidase (beta-lactamase class C family)